MPTEDAEAAVDQLDSGPGRTDFLDQLRRWIRGSHGPRSHEVQDMMIRLDITIGKLLDYLDKKVGAGNYVVAMSADHGVADMPEQNPAGGRQSSGAVRAAINVAMKEAFAGDGEYVAAISGNDIYFKPGIYDRLKADAKTLGNVRKVIGTMSGIARLLTSDEVSTPAARTSKDALVRAAALSYFPGRSGDLLMIPKENWIVVAAGTTHGSPYEYDQRVPVILYGAGIRAGARTEAAIPADLAVTIASMIGVTLPSPDGKVLTAALAK